MKVAILIFATVIVLMIGFLFFKNSQPQITTVQNASTPLPTPLDEKVDIKASFTIITGKITRSFKAEKYHNLSSDVYIESSDPTIIYVKKSGITWDDFFKTLPMKLTKDCLTTGDGEIYCNGKEGTLKFFLNNREDENLLDREIKNGDRILIEYK